MKVGAEPKKLAILAVLLVVAGIVYWMNSREDAPAAPPATAKRTAPPPTAGTAPPPAPGGMANPPAIAQTQRAARQPGRGSQEFRPSLKAKRPEERVDPMKVDPTLRLDLLARVREVKIQGGHRSLFDFSQPPPPKTPDVKIVPSAAKPSPPKPVESAAAPSNPPKPPPPPIPLKFYGYVSQKSQGPKRAFFLEGDEIHVAGEGDLIKKRYRVVRISVNSVVVEDIQYSNQQTLPLEEQPA